MMTASPDDVNTLLIARESITDVTVLLSFLFPLGGGNGKATVGRHNFGGGNGKATVGRHNFGGGNGKIPLAVLYV